MKKRCKNCKKVLVPLPYEKRKSLMFKKRKFCGHRCAALFRWKHKPATFNVPVSKIGLKHIFFNTQRNGHLDIRLQFHYTDSVRVVFCFPQSVYGLLCALEWREVLTGKARHLGDKWK